MGFGIFDAGVGKVYAPRADGDPMIYKKTLHPKGNGGDGIEAIFYFSDFCLRGRLKQVRAVMSVLNKEEVGEFSGHVMAMFRTQDLDDIFPEMRYHENGFVTVLVYGGEKPRYDWCTATRFAYATASNPAGLLLSAGHTPEEVIEKLSGMSDYCSGDDVLGF